MKKEVVGFTAGNFDLLHPGYINCFKDAKEYCDKSLERLDFLSNIS